MEHAYRITMSVIGGLVGYLWGGWNALLGILLAVVALDYATGVAAAYIEKKLSSEVGFKGITKKIFIFVMVAVGHLVDKALGGENSIFKDGVIFFYLANEVLSIVENAGRIGVPVPDQLRNAVEILKGKGEK